MGVDNNESSEWALPDVAKDAYGIKRGLTHSEGQAFTTGAKGLYPW